MNFKEEQNLIYLLRELKELERSSRFSRNQYKLNWKIPYLPLMAANLGLLVLC